MPGDDVRTRCVLNFGMCETRIDPSGKTLASWHHREKFVTPALECYASPRNSSTKGASGPIAAAAQSHVFDDLLRSRAMAPASGIDPIEAMTKSQYAIGCYLRRRARS